MNFSTTFDQSSRLCKFSPNGDFLASASKSKLVVRDVKALQKQAVFSCVDAIQQLEWSPDSVFVLCSFPKKGVVQIWSHEKLDWRAKIESGAMGLVWARWAPDSRHILTMSDYKLRITVWSMREQTATYIKYPKKEIGFSKNGTYMAVAERRDAKDFIMVFCCDGWEMMSHFPVGTKNLADFAFSPNSCHIAVWDWKLEYSVMIYSIDGRFLYEYSAYDHALGVITVSWSPTNEFLVIGSYDEQAHVLNTVTQNFVYALTHEQKVMDANVNVFQEEEKIADSPPHTDFKRALLSSKRERHFVMSDIPFNVPAASPGEGKGGKKRGVGTLLFSHNDSYYMATRNENNPCVVWIWNLRTMKLDSLLVLLQKVKSMEWHPNESKLAVCSGSTYVYIWSPTGCSSTEVNTDEEFLVSNLSWHCGGTALLLVSQMRMCMGYLSVE